MGYSVKKRQTPWWHTALAVLFWLLVWQAASLAVGEQLLLPSPLSVVRALAALVVQPGFWHSIGISLSRIGGGFLLGFFTGCLLGVLAAFLPLIETLLSPLLMLATATPVASFVILAMIWVSSKNLSVFTSFLMVMPVVYANTLAGLQAAPAEMREMAAVFRLPAWRRFRAVYLPALRPYLEGALQVTLALCWKSGLAAEVIGLPRGSIGERLYQAKLDLLTANMFAWTAVAILLSWLTAKAALWLLKKLATALERGRSLA